MTKEKPAPREGVERITVRPQKGGSRVIKPKGKSEAKEGVKNAEAS